MAVTAPEANGGVAGSAYPCSGSALSWIDLNGTLLAIDGSVPSHNPRHSYIAEWLLELSVLLTVFPALDLALENRLDLTLLSGSLTIAVLSFLVGLWLAGKEPLQ